MSKQTEILLESGTNELEILEFTIDGNLYGINVAKIKEIMQHTTVKPMQNSHPDIEGIFKPRDEVITVIDLAKHLHLAPSEDSSHDIFIITNFSKEIYAFHVHNVIGIARISWKNLQKPDEIIYGGQDGVATAIAEYDGRLITILDFEKIIAEINPQSGLNSAAVDKLGNRAKNISPVLVVEDSPLLSRMVVESMHKAGYTNITRVKNGQEAWDYLTGLKDNGKSLESQIACLVTDIEMPEMDGHHLLHLIKDDPILKSIPVVIFSSLINEQLLRVGRDLGASGQFSKPEIVELIKFVDEITGMAH